MRSIRNRLTALFFVIVLGAVCVVYFYVAPQLETRLRDQKLSSLAADAKEHSRRIIKIAGSNHNAKQLDRAVKQAADRSGDRVTLLGVSGGTEGSGTYVTSDSNATTNIDLDFQVADDALRERRVVTGSEASTDGRVGEAAQPIRHGREVTYVVVFSGLLSDVVANVQVIRRQILTAGAIALAVALLAGYLVARAISLRVKRLEEAAEKVAAGDFSQRVPVDSVDELGQLARTFNDMQSQLARLDTARKRFIATASHELRTPIFSLGGFLELLEDEDLDADTRAEFLSQIRAQIDRLTNLATELLDLSKLEAGSLELRPEPVDLGELTRAIAGEFTPALSQHGTALDLRLPEDELEATCDPERVAQILRILIDNAIVHTPEGTGIVVSVEGEDGRARLVVHDSGPGIHRDVLPHVFEPFYTGDDGRGSGLGLAIARELAGRMQGRLEVRSRPGRTSFVLVLPGATVARPAPVPTA
jgi:two-component system OmpR family sensor kinase